MARARRKSGPEENSALPAAPLEETAPPKKRPARRPAAARPTPAQELAEARTCAEALGRQVKEVSDLLEQVVREARAQVKALREEREGLARLDALKVEIAATESRLAAARSKPEEDKANHSAEPQSQGAPAEGKNRLGVTVDPGVVVAEVQPGSPAATAGLLPGDVVTSVDDSPVHTGPELRDLVQAKPAGEQVNLRVTRGGLVTVLHASLPALMQNEDNSEGKNRLGLAVDPSVVVADVLPGSPAAASGLVRGDVITGANGKEVLSGKDLRDAIAELEERAEVTVRFRRAGEPREVTVRLDEPAAEGTFPGMT